MMSWRRKRHLKTLVVCRCTSNQTGCSTAYSEAERSSIYEEYKGREQELIYSQIQRINNGVVYFNLGKAEAILPPKEQVAGERYRVGERLRTVVRLRMIA